MTAQEVTRDAMRGLEVLREAVREELEKKAKLGQQAVVCDENGNVKVLSAKYLIRKMRAKK